MGGFARAAAAAFNAGAMIVTAYLSTDGRATGAVADLTLWGAAAAATVVAFSVASRGLGWLAWLGIGYLLYAALLATGEVVVLVLALAFAMMPLAPRPRGSLAMGIAVAAMTAFVSVGIVRLASAV